VGVDPFRRRRRHLRVRGDCPLLLPELAGVLRKALHDPDNAAVTSAKPEDED